MYTPLCGCVTDGTSSICVEIEIAWLDMEHMDLNILNTYFKKKKHEMTDCIITAKARKLVRK